MKAYVLCALLLCSTFPLFSSNERDIIRKIDSINEIALSHYQENNITATINAFNEAIKLSDSINDDYGIAVANFTLGKIYDYMHEPVDAQRCYDKMLKASERLSDNYLLANAHIKLGEIQNQEERFHHP